ncbi:N-acetylglucosamine kinase [Alicyclobacillus shizuokensis]|uniref:N-acetylglucosamine kinase n=1 Tax=Alicyclobacillus shizuokensis TaxID=392014 RepID=UPI0009F8531F|nr:BadF/BadG/BcrA/BcrD ATPase family protein [Alicyclobacillus shizuokensis]MCL6625262.1 ATPase [Alicyclobacillus shizuokensis]
MRYFLGVDGGGSKTESIIVDEQGNLVGWGCTGGSNHQTIGIQAALANIRESISMAMESAGVKPRDICHAVYGLAGADRPTDHAILQPALSTLPIPSWRVVCDTMIGLRCGSPSNTGVVVVCGSGTNAAGRNEYGVEVQTGGFGYLFGDWAGGGDLARQAFRMAIRSWEGREEPSLLAQRVPDYLGFSDVPAMLDYYLDHPGTPIPRDLAVLVHQTADDGDKLAEHLLWKTGKELGLAAHSVATRLGNLVQPFRLVLIGSVLQRGRHPILLSALDETLQGKGWRYTRVLPKVAPVCGAVWLALDDKGVHLPESVALNWVPFRGNSISSGERRETEV